MAVYSYLLVWAGATLGQELGLFVEEFPAWEIFAWLLFLNLLIFHLIRSGFSERFSDPALTVPQVVLGIVLVTVLLHYSEMMRGALLALYFMVMTFGIFALDRKRMVWMSLFALLCFTTLEVIEALYQPERFLLMVSFGHWAILSLGFAWFVFVGGHMHNLQERNRQQRLSLEAVNSKLQEAMEKLEEIATHDELTGLFNRRYFLERLNEDLARAERSGQPLHLAILDLDHFKHINDTHGHQAGDRFLREFAGVARRVLRRTDLVARYGGEEFVVLFPHGDTADIQDVLERLRSSVEAVRVPELPGVIVTVSTGMTRWCKGDTSDSLLHRADEALYRAKSEGRNRVQLAELSPVS